MALFPLQRTTFAGDCDQLPVDFNMNLEVYYLQHYHRAKIFINLFKCALQACCRFPNVSDIGAEAKIQEFMKNPENSKMTPGDQFTLACVSTYKNIFKNIKYVNI